MGLINIVEFQYENLMGLLHFIYENYSRMASMLKDGDKNSA
jgi:hypothetical protein